MEFGETSIFRAGTMYCSGMELLRRTEDEYQKCFEFELLCQWFLEVAEGCTNSDNVITNWQKQQWQLCFQNSVILHTFYGLLNIDSYISNLACFFDII